MPPNPVWIVENRINETEKMATDAMNGQNSQRSSATDEYSLIWKAIGDLKKRQTTFGSNKVVLVTIAVNASQDAQIIFVNPMPDANYVYEILLTNLVGIALTSFSVTIKKRF